MDVGKINPAVPQACIDKMNALKQRDHRRATSASRRRCRLDSHRRAAPSESRQCRRHQSSRIAGNPPSEFPGIVANDRVDFDLSAARFTRLGENGAGKSTLMNILYGLYQPDAGEIRLQRQAGHVPLARRTRSGAGSGWCTSTSC